MRRLFVFAACLAVAASLAALIMGAGGPAADPKPGEIITGQDLGLRVTGIEGGRVVGTLVVRVDGEWRPVEPPPPPPVVPARPSY